MRIDRRIRHCKKDENKGNEHVICMGMDSRQNQVLSSPLGKIRRSSPCNKDNCFVWSKLERNLGACGYRGARPDA